jgi:hypothetical protein
VLKRDSLDAEFLFRFSGFLMISTSTSDREREVLVHLAKFRFLTAEQLTELLFSLRTDLKDSSRVVMTRQILANLAKRDLVTRTARSIGGADAGSARSAYYLRPAGMAALWELGVGLEPKRTAPRGTFLLRHALALADVALAFQRAARETNGHSLVAWELDWEAAQRGANATVVPDAYMMYSARSDDLYAFIEMDLGTMGSRFFQRKIERYLDLFWDESWKARVPEWPAVLTVTPSRTRAVLLRTSTERMLSERGDAERLRASTEFAFCDLPTLIAEGPLGLIWQVAGNGHAMSALFEDD